MEAYYLCGKIDDELLAARRTAIDRGVFQKYISATILFFDEKDQPVKLCREHFIGVMTRVCNIFKQDYDETILASGLAEDLKLSQ